MKLNIWICMGLLALMICSCTNELDAIKEAEDQSNYELRELASEMNLPAARDGRLTFQNAEQFEQTYLSLNELLDSDEDSFNELVASQLPQQSVLQLFQEDEFSNPSDRIQPFLSDKIMMALVNENYEFIVGEHMYTFVDNIHVVKSNASDSETAALLQNLPKGEQFNAELLPSNVMYTEFRSLTIFAKPLCGCEIYVQLVECNQVRVHGQCYSLFGGDGSGEVEIYITDELTQPTNNDDPIETHAVEGPFEFFVDMNGQPESFVHGSANPNCLFGKTKWDEVHYEPGESVCDLSQNSTGWIWQEDGNQAISYRVHNYVTWYSSYEETELVSYRFNVSKREWQKDRAALDVEISADRKADDCNTFETESDSKSCNNCKSKSVRIAVNDRRDRNSVHHCDGDVIGEVSKTENGVTLSATVEVDYECCE